MAFYVSEPTRLAPSNFETPTQERIYQTLARLEIPFERVETDDGTTMESCTHISQGLGSPVVKSIFVCNRQLTHFYLYITSADKPFVTKDFCGALGIPRVSFAPAEMLWEKLGTHVGATTVLSLINDPKHTIALVIDHSVTEEEYFACSDGTQTCFMKFPYSALIERYLPSTGHCPIII